MQQKRQPGVIIDRRRSFFWRGRRIAQSLSGKERALLKVRRVIEQHITGNGEHMAEQTARPIKRINVDGIIVESGRTGSHPGIDNQGTFRVTIGKNILFVKVTRKNPRTVLEQHRRAAIFLRTQLGNKINGFNVKLIKPRIIHGVDKEPDIGVDFNNGTMDTYIATDFFGKGRVKTIADYSKANPSTPTTNALNRTAEELKQILEKENISRGSRTINTFFEEKTNTLWLFDIDA